MGLEAFYADVVGEPRASSGRRLSELDLPHPLIPALIDWMGHDAILTPPQVDALEAGIITDDAHFIVSAPTNSGKTLSALLRVFVRSLSAGGRFVYVAPLKALAEQKKVEVEELSAAIERHGGRRIKVSIATGDYRISQDLPDAATGDDVELLVCTPEKLEVLLRNPANSGWAGGVDTYVLDEFHILGSKTRGARYEAMVTRLLITCPRSCLLALSATVGSLEHVVKWLSLNNHPVRVLSSAFRAPALRRSLLRVERKDPWVAALVDEVLPVQGCTVLIFVYRQNDAEKLARELCNLHGQGAAAAFHSNLPLGNKQRILAAFGRGELRILVATTSLAMGINSPASHVVVRDTVFAGVGQLAPSEILQMIGRAGRGGADGHAYVLFGLNENVESLYQALVANAVEPLWPRLVSQSLQRHNLKRKGAEVAGLRTALLTEIASSSTVQVDQLLTFVSHTYSATWLAVSPALIKTCIEDLVRDKLVYRIENAADVLAATPLGRTSSHSGLSAETGAMFGRFLRALISLSEKDELREKGLPSYLQRLTSLDFLMVLMAAPESRKDSLAKSFKPDSEKLVDYLETLPPDEKPLLYQWRDEDSEQYPTRRLLSTLGLPAGEHAGAFVRLMSAAAALHEYAFSRAQPEEIAIAWGLRVDIEGRLSPLATWSLSALANICTGSRCYKLDFLLPRIRCLIEDIAIGGGMGPLVALPNVGVKTIERLRSAGYSSIENLGQVSTQQLRAIGLTAPAANAISRYCGRRQR